MADSISRRLFTAVGTGLALGSATSQVSAEDKTSTTPIPGPIESHFELKPNPFLKKTADPAKPGSK